MTKIKFTSLLVNVYICLFNPSILLSQTPLKTVNINGQQVMVAADELCVKLKANVSDATLQSYILQYNSKKKLIYLK